MTTATLPRTCDVIDLDMQAGEQSCWMVGEEAYWCRDVLGGWEVEKESTRAVYFVAVHHNRPQSCTCPDFKYRRQKNAGACKHMALAARLQEERW